MYKIRKRYDDLPVRKQRVIRNKWRKDFDKSEPSFYARIENPTVEDLKYFAVVFGCTMDELVEPSEMATKARPLAELLKDASNEKAAAELGMSK